MTRVRPLLADAGLAAVLLVVSLGWSAAVNHLPVTGHRVDVLGVALVLLAAAVLAGRRRWPLPVLAVAAGATALYLALGYPYGPVLLCLLVAVYTVARHRRLGVSVPAAAVALLALLVHPFTSPAALPGFSGVLPASAWVVLPFAVGAIVRANREQAAAARAEVLRQHAEQERLRVVREVHDVVGHGLAAIKMQADIALHLLDREPGRAETALTAISRTSTSALDELRATLALVRDRAPTPGLDRLPDLVARTTDGGVTVDLDTTGEPRALPASVDFAAYRVLQESLTNVLKHAVTKAAAVRLDYRAEDLALTVTNPAPAGAPTGDGFGIPGMRERVTALGGAFSAGPRDGRFEVTATLPTRGGR